MLGKRHEAGAVLFDGAPRQSLRGTPLIPIPEATICTLVGTAAEVWMTTVCWASSAK
jgi:hypothetical protein